MRCTALLLLIAGCGRFGFDSAREGQVDALGTGIDGATDRPNVAFVTRDLAPGNFGGLAGGDALCKAAAEGAGLPGVFRAFLSTSTVAARDRFAGSRGWVRVDGAPIANTIDDMVTGKMFNAIDLDEYGNPAAPDAWTGTRSGGTFSDQVGACDDWTGTTGFGALHNTNYAMVLGLSGIGGGCSGSDALFCLEVGHDKAVAPVSETGRLVFPSAGRLPGSSGVAAFDMQCAQEASTAGRAGTFRAAIATTTASVASRFTLDARPWVRIDGTRVADPAAIFDGAQLQSFAHQRLDGAYVPGAYWVGAMTAQSPGTLATTCDDWSASTTGTNIPVGYSFAVGDIFWGARVGAANCTDGWNVLCLEQ